ncbi:zinc-containing alcohol dehydrogenase [Hypoxylon sp. FL0890]|nr:zinc-containing alcohol dehydrogenase [Hypoxylon sp. FL0890]
MAQSIPKTTRQWNISGTYGLETLKFTEQPVPQLGDTEVLVKIHGASLNDRDILVAQGEFSWDLKVGIVPGSDGAGVVLDIGKKVTRFQPGDKVITRDLSAASFDEQALVSMPEGLTFTEAATLTCAGVSAGDCVLTQGTGGVSIFALQFAKAVGARVIATTSSSEKAKLLERLGADHIINYRETPEWGSVARQLTGGVGVDHVVEVAGPSTMRQSVASVKLDGVIVIMGYVGSVPDSGEAREMPGLMDCWIDLFTARGIWAGSRLQMEDMCRAFQANIEKLRPVVDPKVFTLEQVKESYDYLSSGKHQGKVCIEIN